MPWVFGRLRGEDQLALRGRSLPLTLISEEPGPQEAEGGIRRLRVGDRRPVNGEGRRRTG